MKASMEDMVAAWIPAPEDRRAEALRVLRGEVAATPSPRSEGPLLLGMGQAAKYLGVSRPTLWRILQLGRLEKVEMLPGSYRMRRADLDAYVANNGTRGKAAADEAQGESGTDRAEPAGRAAMNQREERDA